MSIHYTDFELGSVIPDTAYKMFLEREDLQFTMHYSDDGKIKGVDLEVRLTKSKSKMGQDKTSVHESCRNNAGSSTHFCLLSCRPKLLYWLQSQQRRRKASQLAFYLALSFNLDLLLDLCTKEDQEPQPQHQLQNLSRDATLARLHSHILQDHLLLPSWPSLLSVNNLDIFLADPPDTRRFMELPLNDTSVYLGYKFDDN